MCFCSWCGDVVEGSVSRFGHEVMHPECREEMEMERDDAFGDFIDDEDCDPRFVNDVYEPSDDSLGDQHDETFHDAYPEW